MNCSKCGAQIKEGQSFCSECGAPVEQSAGYAGAPVEQYDGYNEAPAGQYDGYNEAPAGQYGGAYAGGMAPAAEEGPYGTLALILGIVSLAGGIIGGITFGTFAALLFLACGIVGIVFAVKTRKATGEQKGMGAFICSLLGIVFAAMFTFACSFCDTCTCGYGKYGIIGSGCKMQNDAEDLNDALQDLQRELDNLDIQ